MLDLYEFSKTRKNRSNNSGKIDYIALDKILKTDYSKNPKFAQFSSKSPEKKGLRRDWQHYLLHIATNISNATQAELKEIDKTIKEVIGTYNCARDLYAAKSVENEELIKQLYSALKTIKK